MRVRKHWKKPFTGVDPLDFSPGMQVTAEIHFGSRSIFEYLLSPVLGAFQEAGRERRAW